MSWKSMVPKELKAMRPMISKLNLILALAQTRKALTPAMTRMNEAMKEVERN